MKLTKKEALNEVAKVLQAALEEYESLEKSFGEEGEEPSEEEMAAQAAAAEQAQAEGEVPSEEEAPSDEEAPAEEEEIPAEGEEEAPAEEAAPSEEEDEMDDETLKSEFAKMQTKMESRGLLKKSEPKSEGTDLKKYEGQISDLTKTVNDLQAAIKKISNTPAPRKGATGYSPLKKNTEEEGAPLNKAEVVNKLLDLKKSGKNVPTSLINRIEGNRLTNEDVTIIKGLIG